MASPRKKSGPQLKRDLYQELGHALSAWADLEDGLFEAFQYVTKMRQDRVARAVFYSARSFLGRSDMLLAALAAHEECDECFDRRELIWAITKKAVGYNGIRNTLAHNSLSPGGVEDGHVWEWTSPTSAYGEPGLTTEQIRTARENFQALARLSLRAALRPTLSKEQIQELLAQVRKLPKRADSNEETPMPRVWKKRQKPSPP